MDWSLLQGSLQVVSMQHHSYFHCYYKNQNIILSSTHAVTIKTRTSNLFVYSGGSPPVAIETKPILQPCSLFLTSLISRLEEKEE